MPRRSGPVRLTRRLAGVSAVVLACAGGLAARQAPGLPTPPQIFARHVSAIGGAAAFKAVKSIHERGRFEIPSTGIGGDLEVFAARPAKLLFRVNIPGIGRLENGYNGTVGWLISPSSGPELLSGRQLSETADDAWFDGALHEPNHVRDAQTLEQVEFDGRQAYKLHVVLRSGLDETEYFDVAAGYWIGSDASRASSQGIVPTVTILRDYRKFGKVMQPATLVQKALGLEQVVTVTSCEYDTVKDSTFDLPPDVLALIRK